MTSSLACAAASIVVQSKIETLIIIPQMKNVYPRQSSYFTKDILTLRITPNVLYITQIAHYMKNYKNIEEMSKITKIVHLFQIVRTQEVIELLKSRYICGVVIQRIM